MSRSIAHSDVRQSQDRPVILVDADNTLWDTDKVFAEAQIHLFLDVKREIDTNGDESNRLDFIRSVDQSLAEQHHLGLRYPPRLLITALALAMSGYSIKEAVRFSWRGGRESKIISREIIEEIQGRYFEDLRTIPPLMPGVKIGLNELHRTGARILVLTEGHRDRVLRTAQAHGIMTMIDRVIEAKKNRRFFARILRLVGNPSSVVMIGDQITKDIMPAKEAGLFTVYIQGRFQPKWESKNTEGIADIQLDSFAKVPYAVAHLPFKDTDIKPKISS